MTCKNKEIQKSICYIICPHKSYSEASSTFTVTICPTLIVLVFSSINRLPSISGASAFVRQVATPSSSILSTITSSVSPTLLANLAS